VNRLLACVLLSGCATLTRPSPATQPASAPTATSLPLNLGSCLFLPQDPTKPLAGPYLTSRDCLVAYAVWKEQRDAQGSIALADAKESARVAADEAASQKLRADSLDLATKLGIPAATVISAVIAALVAHYAH
jgi:hypothetical protein